MLFPACICHPKSGSCVTKPRMKKAVKRRINSTITAIRCLIVLLYNENMKITNRKATYDYQLLDRFEAGINLVGAEVKAVREGHVDLSGSFVRIIGGQAHLV